jgi:Na+-driven multidrug efflux pump
MDAGFMKINAFAFLEWILQFVLHTKKERAKKKGVSYTRVMAHAMIFEIFLFIF